MNKVKPSIQAVGLAILIGALLVTAPRYVYAFLVADGLTLDAWWERALIIASAVFTALVLTGGNAFMAHMLSLRMARRGPVFWMLLSAWAASIVLAAIILAPVFVASLAHSALATVLASDWQRAGYGTALALAVEVAVAGVAAAYALTHDAQTPTAAEPQEQQHEARPAAPASAEPQAERTRCQWCERDFGSANALRAHEWRCVMKDTAAVPEVVPATNGHTPH